MVYGVPPDATTAGPADSRCSPGQDLGHSRCVGEAVTGTCGRSGATGKPVHRAQLTLRLFMVACGDLRRGGKAGHTPGLD